MFVSTSNVTLACRSQNKMNPFLKGHSTWKIGTLSYSSGLTVTICDFFYVTLAKFIWNLAFVGIKSLYRITAVEILSWGLWSNSRIFTPEWCLLQRCFPWWPALHVFLCSFSNLSMLTQLNCKSISDGGWWPRIRFQRWLQADHISMRPDDLTCKWNRRRPQGSKCELRGRILDLWNERQQARILYLNKLFSRHFAAFLFCFVVPGHVVLFPFRRQSKQTRRSCGSAKKA